MSDILTEARKIAAQAEVYETRVRRTPVSFEANKLKQVQTKESSSTALRLFKNGRVGFAVASGPIDPKELVQMAVDTAQFGPEIEFDLPGSQGYPHMHTYDPAIENVSIESLVDLGKALIEKVRDHTPDVVCECGVTRGVAEVHLTNSRGGEVRYRRSVFGLNLDGMLVREGELIFVGDGENSCKPFTDFSRIAATTIRQLELARVRTAIATKTMPVIFTPIGVASVLVSPLAIAFNGKLVVEGSSALKDRRGQRVFDPKFNMWDDPTIEYQPATCPCDDEGVPSRRTALSDKGVVSGFLFDLRTAKLADERSTGSGRRSGGLPSPGISSLVIGDGETAYADMVKGIKEGIVIELTMGTEQGNLLSGDFAGNVLLGFSIKDGEIMGRVKDTVISGNVFKLLDNISAISKESRWVGGYLRTPYICCPSISVASKGKQ